eukprot:Protomagalhaensia_wolfi_Nauph_80__1532@NODE_1934_length_1272_cov_145_021087_g1513_i0_p1_GENE_NODE_1934_length_1272_cov_145_021087_g1513_i0NODE_1934_length_1272_cov_145_021087_g1513_i0_p1_ORF_typecomplete_len347_score65_22AsnA/PF03590_15/1_2e95tRNAsynt_2/PF00152_20/2_6e02tRNAsynt_2/PF00152_20/1_3e06_NODE_1934_length_1272_cov_145_021087_g1513_i0451085
MPNLVLPEDYHPMLTPEMMEKAIEELRVDFQRDFAEALNLRRVTAPLMVLAGTGLNDDLNGIERAVSFPVKDLNDRTAEIVHSLAKWKRTKLAAFRIPRGFGLWTNMNAIRADEVLDNIHSIYVDQWDWEQTIGVNDRNLAFLKATVNKIYQVFLQVEQSIYKKYPHITPCLPPNITFIQAEDLLQQYPKLSPAERENEACRNHGAVFLIGIGADLSNGARHDGRAPDYDDWSSPTEGGKYQGLNGDILVWNPILKRAFEISSMGIRVDKKALLKQLQITGHQDRQDLMFHKMLLEDRVPLSIGGGIGQSRLCMFLLRAAHIGEVQASLWPDEMVQQCFQHNIFIR